MIAAAFPVDLQKEQSTKVFRDCDIQSISILYTLGFVNGYPDGTFHPYEKFTQAQIVTMLDNIIDEYIVEPGTYDQLTGKRIFIAAPNVTLRNKEKLEYLVVAPGAAGGKRQ